MNIEKGFFLNLLLLSEDFFAVVEKCRCTLKRMSVIWAFIVLRELITIDLCKILPSKGKKSLLHEKNCLQNFQIIYCRKIENRSDEIGFSYFYIIIVKVCLTWLSQ